MQRSGGAEGRAKSIERLFARRFSQPPASRRAGNGRLIQERSHQSGTFLPYMYSHPAFFPQGQGFRFAV